WVKHDRRRFNRLTGFEQPAVVLRCFERPAVILRCMSRRDGRGGVWCRSRSCRLRGGEGRVQVNAITVRLHLHLLKCEFLGGTVCRGFWRTSMKRVELLEGYPGCMLDARIGVLLARLKRDIDGNCVALHVGKRADARGANRWGGITLSGDEQRLDDI